MQTHTLLARESGDHPRFEERESLRFHTAGQILCVCLLLIGSFWGHVQSEIRDPRIDPPGHRILFFLVLVHS